MSVCLSQKSGSNSDPYCAWDTREELCRGSQTWSPDTQTTFLQVPILITAGNPDKNNRISDLVLGFTAIFLINIYFETKWLIGVHDEEMDGETFSGESG